ncbi:MAG TPA: hypothetical protein VF407_09560, partial [Polyangiaceae bacterium]
EFHVLNATTSKPELDLARAKTIGVVLVSQDVYTWNASASMPRTVDTYTQPGGPAPLYGTATYSASTTTRTFRPK